MALSTAGMKLVKLCLWEIRGMSGKDVDSSSLDSLEDTLEEIIDLTFRHAYNKYFIQAFITTFYDSTTGTTKSPLSYNIFLLPRGGDEDQSIIQYLKCLFIAVLLKWKAGFNSILEDKLNLIIRSRHGMVNFPEEVDGFSKAEIKEIIKLISNKLSFNDPSFVNRIYNEYILPNIKNFEDK